ncbi:hypothetical protein FRC06_008719 [Ceratobasidium sp. 370]|nr:hypothetical protein FRC06_008719 [Ceratobasidium sp. 370]
MAGTGKTTIAHSFCTSLKVAHQLAASFFCSRSLPECRNVARIVPTIAYQLARFSRPFQDVLCRVLGDDPDIGICDAKTQFEKLMSEPLMEVKDTLPPGLLVVVIDALDECSDGVDLMPLYQTARRAILKAVNICCHDDIMLGMTSSSSSKAYEPLDALYTAILASALEDEELEAWDKDNIELVLHTVVCAREPLAMEALAFLFQFESSSQAERAIEPLKSVLHADERTGLVSTLHASFPDYMHTAARSGRFFCDEASHDKLLARRCFGIMERSLRFNICDLESSFVLDKDVPDISSRIHDDIPLHLFYACRYWSSHLILASDGGDLLTYLTGFLHHQALYWAEVLNLKESTRIGVAMLSETFAWLRDVDAPDEICAICQDAQKFLSVIGANSVCKSTPHICISILALWNQQDPIWAQYGARMQGLVKAEGSIIENTFSPDCSHVASGSSDRTIRIWDAQTGQAVVSPFKGHTNVVLSVAYSPGGNHIVSGSADATIRIWDALVSPFEGHTNEVLSVAYSPDGGRIVSGSNDRTIRIWDTLTGHTTVGPLLGHTSRVNTVAFSPDGHRVAPGSYDFTACIWDAITGHPLVDPLVCHTDAVRGVAYSPDGRRLVSASQDLTVRIWDVHMGKTAVFVPDVTRVVSGSADLTICVWDARSGKVRSSLPDGHIGEVCSVKFSPDSSQIVSGSGDRTVCIRGAMAGSKKAGSFRGHTSYVYSVAISPKGDCVASGSVNHTIRVWDAQTGTTLSGPLGGHNDQINSVTFSLDGSCVVSGSNDHTIRVWDVQTGNTKVGPWRGHTDNVLSVVYWPGGDRIASGSSDRTIRIGDAQTGIMVAGPFEGHDGGINSVTYSPGSDSIASCSDDHTIRIWDICTGETAVGPLTVHSDKVFSIAYSPDGHRIASDSRDGNIGVLDVKTGKILAGPFNGHTDWFQSVAFSPDGCFIASGSDGGAIRV